MSDSEPAHEPELTLSGGAESAESPPVAEPSSSPTSTTEPPEKSRPRRSSIRPASPDWRPSSRGSVRPPSPMVVVYSGESTRPPPQWEVDHTRTPVFDLGIEARSQAQPFPLAADLPTSAADLPPPRPAMAGQNELETSVTEPSPTGSQAANSTASGIAAAHAMPEPRARPAAAEEQRGAAHEPEPTLPPESESIPKSPPSKFRYGALVILAMLVGMAGSLMVGRPATEARVSRRIAVEPTPTVVAVVTPEPAPAAALANAQPAPSPTESAPLPAALLAADSAPPTAQDTQRVPGEGAPFLRVTLELRPRDAKVFLRGVSQKGPPFEFDVPRGRHVAVEAARKGYITRKVVLDGTQSRVVVGLTPTPGFSRPESDSR